MLNIPTCTSGIWITQRHNRTGTFSPQHVSNELSFFLFFQNNCDDAKQQLHIEVCNGNESQVSWGPAHSMQLWTLVFELLSRAHWLTTQASCGSCVEEGRSRFHGSQHQLSQSVDGVHSSTARGARMRPAWLSTTGAEAESNFEHWPVLCSWVFRVAWNTLYTRPEYTLEVGLCKFQTICCSAVVEMNAGNVCKILKTAGDPMIFSCNLSFMRFQGKG